MNEPVDVLRIKFAYDNERFYRNVIYLFDYAITIYKINIILFIKHKLKMKFYNNQKSIIYNTLLKQKII
jgi:hypothetical protein